MRAAGLLVEHQPPPRRSPTSQELDAAERARRLLALAQRYLASLEQDAQDSSPEADQRRAACSAWAERVWHASEGEEPRNNRTGLVLSAIDAAAAEQARSPEPIGLRVSDVIGRLDATFNRTLADRLREEPGRELAAAAVEAWAMAAQAGGRGRAKWPAARALLEHLFPGKRGVPDDLERVWRKWKERRGR